MFRSLFLILVLPFSAALADEWPTLDQIRVGDTFKYPIVGIPGARILPTQAAVGARAIAAKVAEMEDMGKDELKDELKRDPAPVVAAPDGNFYVIDHHHQTVAAHLAGRENVYFRLEKNYSKLPDLGAFWARMKANGWVREFDHRGRPIQVPQGLPKSMLKLPDDPFRSLAWFVRKAGGYKKTDVEFAEFQWADFFRARISIGRTDKHFHAAVESAEALAHTDEAKGLPGWSRRNTKCSGFFESGGSG